MITTDTRPRAYEEVRKKYGSLRSKGYLKSYSGGQKPGIVATDAFLDACSKVFGIDPDDLSANMAVEAVYLTCLP